jgi:hypothetical protein
MRRGAARTDELARPGTFESDDELAEFLADLHGSRRPEVCVTFVVLNTDVASASLRGRLPDQPNARLAGQSLCITFVTLVELTKWTHVRSWGPRRLADLPDCRRHGATAHRCRPWVGPPDLETLVGAGEGNRNPHCQLGNSLRIIAVGSVTRCVKNFDLPSSEGIIASGAPSPRSAHPWIKA